MTCDQILERRGSGKGVWVKLADQFNIFHSDCDENYFSIF